MLLNWLRKYHPPQNTDIKVLFVTYEYKKKINGGVGRVISGISSFLKNHILFDVLLFGWRHVINVYSGTVYCNNGPFNKETKRRYFTQYQKIVSKIILRGKYNVLHLVCLGKETVEFAEMVKKEFPEIKVVYSCHSIAKYEKEIRNNREEEIEHESRMLEVIDYIHFLNQSSINYFSSVYPLCESKKSFIIPNGIDEKDYTIFDKRLYNSLRKEYKCDDNLIVFCLSRWSFGKGLEALLDAVPEVIAQFPNIKFVIAGRKLRSWENNVDQYVEAIDERIEKLRGHVIPVGWLNDRERNTYFKIADMVIMPSELEYFPYSLLEPMICKVPLISSRIPCAEELLEEYEECLFFSDNPSERLPDQILRLANDHDLRKTFSTNAYFKVKKNYNMENIARQYANMYSVALSHQPSELLLA